MREEAQWWLSTALRDKAMAQALAEGRFFEGAVFHAQQGAEKALKALLLANRSDWPRTHSATVLLGLLRERGLDVPAGLDTQARRLDVHYIDSRYPNSVGGPPEMFYDATIAAEAMAALEAILSFVEAGIGR